MTDVMCVGAHPDDVEIGMGGAVASMVKSGLEVIIVDLTDGEPTPKGTHETRMSEAAKAASALGVKDRRTLSQPNRYLMDTVEARTELAEVIRETRPKTLFVPYPEDAHPDHVAASAITKAARFYAKFTKTDMAGEPHYPARIYHYMAVHMSVIREPSFVLDVSAQLDRELRALRAYESQFTKNDDNKDVIAMVEQTARSWGSTIRVAAGEPFFALEPLGLGILDPLL